MAGVGGGLHAADRLCAACVELLRVDGAAISLMHSGASQGTFGSSSTIGKRVNDYQFALGEGPCLDAIAGGRTVSVADLADAREKRWPAFSSAVLAQGVRAVFAIPTEIATVRVGVLDLFSSTPGALSAAALDGGLWAAKLAALPIMDEIASDIDRSDAANSGNGWDELASLERVEVYQATGMLMGQLGVNQVEALARLRGLSFASARTASEVAWDIVERKLVFESDPPTSGVRGTDTG